MFRKALALLLTVLMICPMVSCVASADKAGLERNWLITNVYGDGQKPWIIVLEYSEPIDASSVTADDYSTETYDIESVYVNDKAELPESSTDGSFVLLELSTSYTTTGYGGPGPDGSNSMSGGGPGGQHGDRNEGDRPSGDPGAEGFSGPSGEMGGNGGPSGMANMFGESASNQFTVTFSQTGDIQSVSGTVISGSDDSVTTDYHENDNLLVKNFSLDTFTLSDGTTMMYSLYLPSDYDEDKTYPLVLFMPDATGEGSDEYKSLTESLGGVIWSEESWQESPDL